ncbi:molybdopterin-dependent oxidoreductase [Streptomyces sp. M19]
MTIGTPVETVLDGRDALLAVGMNGEPLPLAHGFPVRMVVPGLYGYVSACKWLNELELTTFEEFDAYWVKRSWSARAPIKTSPVSTPQAAGERGRGHGARRRGRVGPALGRRPRGGARRRRALAAGPARGRGQRRHLAPVGVAVARHTRDPPPGGPRDRPQRLHTDRPAPGHRARRRHRTAFGGGHRDLTPPTTPTISTSFTLSSLPEQPCAGTVDNPGDRDS